MSQVLFVTSNRQMNCDRLMMTAQLKWSMRSNTSSLRILAPALSTLMLVVRRENYVTEKKISFLLNFVKVLTKKSPGLTWGFFGAKASNRKLIPKTNLNIVWLHPHFVFIPDYGPSIKSSAFFDTVVKVPKSPPLLL